KHTASGLEGGEVRVVLRDVGGVYRLEVGDDGAAGARPHVKDEVGAETGRGMRIVAARASRWGCRADGPWTRVRAGCPAPPPAAASREGGGPPDGGRGRSPTAAERRPR